MVTRLEEFDTQRSYRRQEEYRKHRVTYINSFYKCMAERKLRGMAKGPKLLKMIMDRILRRTMIAYVYKVHDRCSGGINVKFQNVYLQMEYFPGNLRAVLQEEN